MPIFNSFFFLSDFNINFNFTAEWNRWHLLHKEYYDVRQYNIRKRVILETWPCIVTGRLLISLCSILNICWTVPTFAEGHTNGAASKEGTC